MANDRTTTARVALITGGSKGLGFALASFLAAREYTLIITARDASRLHDAQERLQEGGSTVIAMAGDVSDPAHLQRLAAAVGRFERLDLLINNASTLGPLPMLDLVEYAPEDLRRVLEVNTLAPLALVRAVRPAISAGRGLVVNISSDAASGGYEGWGAYGASKAALDLISKTLANELQTDGITVVSVDPGDLRTDMHQDAFPGEDISDRPLPEVTLPFWAWLLGQEPEAINGGRFQAQSELWKVAA